ncbi:MAG: Metallophosphoesterase [Candidatus Parvarchaeum acidophilus ARMAN-5_'5-way FS']|jgi:Icc-related predicted phosphoesterase|uniref:Metallophosphoesterase n=2 Tax=Parvarchaeum acidophilus TaxID=662761 RepID=D6GWC7_PARA5|nr:MAG: metallophosphoesterase [Candidatus Parvarchaeum acidophilus ARMAN-5]EGD71905.1 MAG: Metallophosphoesterase [Candidatus Parvarchaeum acidophilus ARMAN-5_'5-way FS']
MKILAASDIHGDLYAADALAKKAKREKADLVILAGDLSIFGNGLEGLLKPFKDAGKKVAIIPGNHDSEADIFMLKRRYSDTIYDLHNYSFKIGDIGFFGCGLANIGPNELSEDEIRDRIKASYNYIKGAKKKIMVVHVPPYNTKLDTIRKNMKIGSTSVRDMIEKIKPEICICGHVHETFSLEDKLGNTRVINAGPKGKIIEI